MGLFEIGASFLALTLLEIILGVDNIVLLAVLTEKLPAKERQSARTLGLTLAWVFRLLLLFMAVWIVKYTRPFFSYANFSFSVRDLFLILGGIFLLLKATQEIHQEVTHELTDKRSSPLKASLFWSVVIQVGFMDIIFSFDSVLTAIGLTKHFYIMASAITCAVILMIFAAKWICLLINKYPTVKMLALSFLMLIGMILVADGFSVDIPRAYVYFAMGFSLGVEILNLAKNAARKRKKR
ncbi:MAG: hypothetical protein A3F18_01785 [Legionellales bacterium RIFCSPHIGHO2_12_FULL_37_14]|nr:MAG: hypothetical protein A3F18_01785 [Legionellales bacterium RIFCSPHIGHO2_12_FULL_37_14]